MNSSAADASRQRRPTIVARCGVAKPRYLSYLPSEVFRLRNLADMLNFPRRSMAAVHRGSSARSGPGVLCSERPKTWFGSYHGLGAALAAGIESSPVEAGRTTAWHPSKI